jgi:hopene-associated glycosyltransferase HpnB
MSIWLAITFAALAVWLVVVMLPWQPFRTHERLTASPVAADLGDITVIIPARNEAANLGKVLAALARQGPGLHVVVVDDESVDATRAIAAASARVLQRARDADYAVAVEVLAGKALPAGWGGKLWALEQGLERCRRPLVLLLDGDIELAPGVLPALLAKIQSEGAALASVMAQLRCSSFWEKLLVPPFILFFKLLYPFALVRKPSSKVAAAAGGCILVRADVLRDVGAFDSFRDALIDDCTLAQRIKRAGHGLWLGLSHDVVSLRRYDVLGEFWSMVARTAFTQLHYSISLLVATTLLMLLVFVVPLVAPFAGASAATAGGAIATLALMLFVFTPVVRFYGIGIGWVFGLPFAAVLFLAMTWHSAIHYWAGTRAQWKSRTYEVSARR